MNYIINTPCGKIKGIQIDNEDIIAYKGVRYASAKRFEYPIQVTSWQGVYDASKYGNCSYQPRAFYDEEKNIKKQFYYNEFRKGETYTYSEDCLFLNIFRPKSAKKGSNLPVIVYIHGGGFSGGCGHEKHFDIPVWPKKDVIGVTINYRLGPLGFACIKQAKEKDGHTGNYGLFDQLTAIKWIYDNIYSFGGDNQNITIMGQSAGAMSVQHLCLSTLTKGLFNKAVMCSGGGVSKMMPITSQEKNFSFWDKVMKQCNCSTLEEFQNVDIEALFNSWDKIKKEEKGAFMASSPVIDGLLITDKATNLIKENRHNDIAFMVGSTSEDIIPPIIHKMAKKFCSIQNKPSYCWMFEHQLPGDENGAWHSSDLWYWFGTLKNCWRPFKEEDYDLSELMVSYLTTFAKYGDPNEKKLPLWPCQTNNKEILHFGRGKAKLKKVKTSKLWHNMLTKKSVGE